MNLGIEKLKDEGLISLYNEKLYYQLEKTLFSRIMEEAPGGPLLSADFLISLFEGDLVLSFNPVETVKLVSMALEKNEASLKVEEMGELVGKLSKFEDPNAQCMLLGLKLRISVLANRSTGQFEEAHQLSDQCDQRWKALYAPVALCRSIIYLGKLALYKALEDDTKAYEAGVEYFECTSLNDVVDAPGKLKTMVIQGIRAANTFSYGNLVELEVSQTYLDQTPWLAKLLRAFVDGNYQAYEEVKKEHDLVSEGFELALLDAKFKFVSLLELLFHKSNEERLRVSFEEIYQHCQADVEDLIIKALSRGLIQGRIDSVDQCVKITWIRPAYLDKLKVAHLKLRVEAMKTAAEHTYQMLKSLTPELLQKPGMTV
jgi:hypothetical protein